MSEPTNNLINLDGQLLLLAKEKAKLYYNSETHPRFLSDFLFNFHKEAAKLEETYYIELLRKSR